MPDGFQVQTRSEEGGLCNYSTIEEAMEAAEKDKSIWKISFDAPSGERVRLIRLRNKKKMTDFFYDPIRVKEIVTSLEKS